MSLLTWNSVSGPILLGFNLIKKEVSKIFTNLHYFQVLNSSFVYSNSAEQHAQSQEAAENRAIKCHAEVDYLPHLEVLILILL